MNADRVAEALRAWRGITPEQYAVYAERDWPEAAFLADHLAKAQPLTLALLADLEDTRARLAEALKANTQLARRADRLEADLDEYKRRVTLGGPPPRPSVDWANPVITGRPL